MSDGTSLINLGELSKPVTTLIEKIADATGVLYEPRRIRKTAEAQAEADLIRAESQIKITDIQKRALTRFVQEEGKKQENIEDITEGTIPLLNEKSEPENIDDDWIASFFDKCRLVSDKEMQELWSKVLAGEASSPNSFSKRTLDCLASLDKSDAELFTILCGFGIQLGEIQLLIYETENPIYLNNGLNFIHLKHLDSIGLISFDNMGGYRRTGQFKNLFLRYYGEILQLDFSKSSEETSFQVGHVILTQTGQQLAKLCKSKAVNGFMEYLVDFWIKKSVKVISPYPRIRTAQQNAP